MAGPALGTHRANRPPWTPRTMVATRPPARPWRDRTRPVTPRRRLAPPAWRSAPPLGPAISAFEGWAIDEWRRAVRDGNQLRTRELSQFLWTANRSLVERAARRLRGVALEEARQISALALYRALERFDTSRGVPFAAYATWWFRKEGQAGQAATKFAVALPPHRLSALTSGSSPSDATLRALAATAPLDLVDWTESEHASSPEDAVVAALTTLALHQEVARLAPITRQIVTLRFGFDGGEPKSNRAVAKLLGLSDFTVRTHVARALRTLRSRADSLRD